MEYVVPHAGCPDCESTGICEIHPFPEKQQSTPAAKRQQRSDTDLSAALWDLMLDLNTALCDCHERPERAVVYELLSQARDNMYDARAAIEKAK